MTLNPEDLHIDSFSTDPVDDLTNDVYRDAGSAQEPCTVAVCDSFDIPCTFEEQQL